MGKTGSILKSRKGDGLVFILILIFFIMTLAAIVIEYFRMDSLYQQVEYVLQRGVNSSVEYAMLDEYRKDGYARMDSVLAEEQFYGYLHENMQLDRDLNKYSGEQWVYTLEIQSLTATDDPPRLILKGQLKTRSVFSFLTGEVRLPFTLSSSNNRIDEGGSP
ncbi:MULTISPECIES: hypothetical protein [unclassified Dehalobacter]|uniref:hypothetical protein n=1 Tax=unclassified Dehalobacter TaxID=2635733 RepID=UPI00028A9350|nr:MULTISPECIES: hypothetical protein [unclassified Dehalobacter]AFV02325.1 hypothetical protein DHBDCA_p1296 [Dehalobacter sp. DCA]AFV05368.1 hypothetical protein DCF50_p1362 [Dehalobacter sp. CF]